MDLLTLAVALKNGGGGGGGSEVTVDPSLSPSSPNPVRNSAIYAALDGKADKTALDGYATDEDVEDAIQDSIGDITRFEYYLCGASEYDAQGVPTVANPDTNHIYLTPTAGTNLNMYAYINNAFTFLGTTEVDLDGYAKTADLADVATTGSYNDLSNKPTIPTAVTVDSSITQGGTNPVEGGAIHTALVAKANTADLAAVAFSGAYTDLSGKPSLASVATSGAYSDLSGKPSLATVATSGAYSDLSGKPNLATVATSGSYNDLSNKPTIPVVPSNIVTGSTKSYTIVVSNSAPAAGTADNIITIVV